jgi:dUTPase.
MDFGRLFEMQGQLDAYIEKNRGLNGEDLFERKVLALLVETGELANETRCFKFWSSKGPSPRESILEEYVDGLHFILSLGLEAGLNQEDFLPLPDGGEERDITGTFLELYSRILTFRSTRDKADYQRLIETFLRLGTQLGISEEEIIRAYISKNEVNFRRQEAGY